MQLAFSKVKRMMKPGDVKNPKEQLIKSSTDTPITDYKPAVTSTVTKHMEMSSYEYKKQTVVKPTTAKIQTTPPSYTTTTGKGCTNNIYIFRNLN